MIGWVCRVRLAVLMLGSALLLVGWPAIATAGPAFAPGTWTTSGSLNRPRVFPGAARLVGGGVLVAGGSDAQGHSLASAEIYDPATGTWALTASMHIPRAHPSANLLADGDILIAGGADDFGNALASAELFNATTRTWTLTGSLVDARFDHTSELLPSGQVLAAGGWQQNTGVTLASAELYDPSTRKWTATGKMNVNRSNPPSVLLADGNVLIAGGVKCCYVALSTAEVYNTTTGKWALTGNMRDARTAYPPVLLPNGKVLAAGGETGVCCFFPVLSRAEVYDPRTGSWTGTSAMSAGRAGHVGMVLPDGRVLVAGGENQETTLSSAELYAPSTGAWGPTGSLMTARSIPGASQSTILLRNMNVFVVGGQAQVADRTMPVPSVELYTPPSTAVLPTSCAVTATGTTASGQAYIKIAARDIGSGLQAVTVVQAANTSVTLPRFPPGFRDAAVVTATKVNAGQPSTLKLSVKNRAGTTITCDPVMATLTGQRHGNRPQVFTGLSQNESHLVLENGTPGVERVELRVNARLFRLDGLKSGEERTLDISRAMHSGDNNTVLIRAHGPQDGSAQLVISN